MLAPSACGLPSSGASVAGGFANSATAHGAEVFNLALGRRDSKVSPAKLTRHSHALGGRCPDAASSGSPRAGPLGGEGQGKRAGEYGLGLPALDGGRPTRERRATCALAIRQVWHFWDSQKPGHGFSATGVNL